MICILRCSLQPHGAVSLRQMWAAYCHNHRISAFAGCLTPFFFWAELGPAFTPSRRTLFSRFILPWHLISLCVCSLIFITYSLPVDTIIEGGWFSC